MSCVDARLFWSRPTLPQRRPYLVGINKLVVGRFMMTVSRIQYVG